MINSIKSFLKIEKNYATILSIYQVVQRFYQSDGLEHVRLSVFVEIQTVDFKLVHCLQII